MNAVFSRCAVIHRILRYILTRYSFCERDNHMGCERNYLPVFACAPLYFPLDDPAP